MRLQSNQHERRLHLIDELRHAEMSATVPCGGVPSFTPIAIRTTRCTRFLDLRTPLSRTVQVASPPKRSFVHLSKAMSAGYFIYAGFKPCLKVRQSASRSLCATSSAFKQYPLRESGDEIRKN